LCAYSARIAAIGSTRVAAPGVRVARKARDAAERQWIRRLNERFRKIIPALYNPARLHMPTRTVARSLALAVAAVIIVDAQSAPRSRDQLIARVQQAFKRRSIDEMRQLVLWGRADAVTRESFERRTAEDFDLSVGRVSIEPLRPTEKLEYTVNGITYRPTLSPLGRVNIEFVAPPDARVRGRSTSYLFGSRDGAFYLLTTEPTSP
jgi:hypothetical protein